MQINEIIEKTKSKIILDSIKDYQSIRKIFGFSYASIFPEKKALFSAWNMIKNNSDSLQSINVNSESYNHPFLNSFNSSKIKNIEININNFTQNHHANFVILNNISALDPITEIDINS